MDFILLLFIPIVGFWLFSLITRRRQSEAAQIIEGFLEVLGMNILFGALILLLASVFNNEANFILLGLMGLGIIQFLYVVPRSLSLRRQQRWAKLKGVIGGAVIMLLLNGACWGVFRL
jgi:Na+/proline symporter